MNEKKYVNGISIKIRSGKFGEFLSISICPAMLKQYENENGWVNVTGYKSKKPNEKYGDYYFILNEYTPQKKINEAKNDFYKDENYFEFPNE